MLFDFLSMKDLIVLNFLFLASIIFIPLFIWFFYEVREISEDPRGFIKFGQITFILLSWFIFIVISFYYILKPEPIDSVSIVLTVVVGFLGTIIGLFFSDKALESLSKKLITKDERLKESKEGYIDLIGELDKIVNNIDRIENKKK